ncbi:DUF397 domain-containing protein [Streptomyces caeruleatus]|uniref:DUF397 domain-containing protein n=1 Tax=Streptomyces caeruleatus TaxID=661399 RepID=UPI00099EFF87|nr:DUF397 domain-containing protein [Streptomyces caeruleatus]
MNAAVSESVATELAWFKSSYSGAEGGQCLEVAATSEAVLVRDSKRHFGPVLAVGAQAWAGFVRMAGR